MGKILHFYAKARGDEETPDALASSANHRGKPGQLIIFPGADFSRVLPSLAASPLDLVATPQKEFPR